MSVKRIGQVIKLKPEKYEEYKELHANAWPEVLERIRASNIRNYTIYHYGGYLFSHFEYVGDDFEGDMAKIAADPKTHEWWALTDPCQESLNPDATSSEDGGWWVEMEEVFHTD